MTNTQSKHTWELSEGNTSVWGISPLNARVRIANIIKHSPMNGIDHNSHAYLLASAPQLLEALKTLLKLPCLNSDNLNQFETESIEEAMSAIELAESGKES